MADEIRITTDPDLDRDATLAAHTHPDQLRADVVRTIPAHPTDGIPAQALNDPDVARAEIEHTRSRMSETIDDIEDALTRKKEQIQDRLDVFAPVKENPLPSVGISLGAGLVLGLLTGGDDEPAPRHHYDHGEAEYWEDRAETWESRARRLLRIAQEQEDELEALREEKLGRRGRLASLSRWDEDDYEDDEDDDDYDGETSHSMADDLRDALAERATGFVTNALSQFTGRTGSGGR